MEKQRFSLLLLDPGEFFFEDFSAVMVKIGVADEESPSVEQLGRIKMCSKSIVFDPKDLAKPLLKMPLKECTSINEWDGKYPVKSSLQKNAIAVVVKQYVQMLEGNVIAPYKFISRETTFLFSLNYMKVSDVLPHFCQLHRASGLPVVEHNSMIAAIVFSRQSRVPFDHLWLEDLYEEVVMEVQGSRITPLVSNPGRILLTDLCLYFQPFNNIEQYPVLKIYLRDIKTVVKRRFLLRRVGLELYCGGHGRVQHLLLCLSSQVERDQLHDRIRGQSVTSLEETNQEVMTLRWQNGVISNYEYLQYLNSMADRTYNDLTQYPVFPWVLNDHSSEDLNFDDPASYRDLSKPVGALNPVRLKRLKERYEEMPPPKFLYGSHYSAPGFVLFYLVRKYPHYMLCLQNGRFDHPDRMFNSVRDVWKNVQSNMADFKELVPEFYDVDGEGDFCNNFFGIDFGRRHDGSRVADVELPGWARDSKDFVRKMRNALESDYVSNHLHTWIDLIFGYKQHGEEAVKADNVFYHLCYEGAVDLDSVKDPNQRHALEVQIMEFGQIPKQVFTLPHPSRIQRIPQHHIAEQDAKLMEGAMESRGSAPLQPMGNDPLQQHRDAVSAVAISKKEPIGSGAEWHIFSVGQDSLLKIHQVPGGQQVRSAAVSSAALSACAPLLLHTPHHADQAPVSSTLVVVGSWDNTVAIYDMEYGRVVEHVKLHDDAVSCLAWVEHLGTEEESDAAAPLLATGSWDGSVRLWRILAPLSPISPIRLLLSHPARSLVAQLDHEARVTCIDHSKSARLLASGTEDGDLTLWCMQTLSLKHRLEGHSSSSVSAVRFSPDGLRLVSCGMDSYFRVFDLKTRMQVYSKAMDEQLGCLAWDSSYLLLGGRQGSLYVWDLVGVTLVQQIGAHRGAVTCLAVSSDGSIVVSGGEDRRVLVWSIKAAPQHS
ncbi:protein FAN-like [Hetaerina americana]|uniref:protein FAN-like n=1 Tax=Hetaerina americana TaxID=62018 RepID=UPI003A7F43E7